MPAHGNRRRRARFTTVTPEVRAQTHPLHGDDGYERERRENETRYPKVVADQRESTKKQAQKRDQPSGLLDREKRVEVTRGRSIGHRRADLGHQVAARAVHDRVSSGDDEVLRGHVRLEREPATLSDVTGVDVTPEVPAPKGRVVPEGRKPLVVRGLHDVRETKRDVRRPRPAMQLAS